MPRPSSVTTLLDLGNGIYNFDESRPARNVDVLRFILTRMNNARPRFSKLHACIAAYEEMKRIWTSFGQDLDFPSQSTAVRRMELVRDYYGQLIFRVRRDNVKPHVKAKRLSDLQEYL